MSDTATWASIGRKIVEGALINASSDFTNLTGESWITVDGTVDLEADELALINQHPHP